MSLKGDNLQSKTLFSSSFDLHLLTISFDLNWLLIQKKTHTKNSIIKFMISGAKFSVINDIKGHNSSMIIQRGPPISDMKVESFLNLLTQNPDFKFIDFETDS